MAGRTMVIPQRLTVHTETEGKDNNMTNIESSEDGIIETTETPVTHSETMDMDGHVDSDWPAGPDSGDVEVILGSGTWGAEVAPDGEDAPPVPESEQAKEKAPPAYLAFIAAVEAHAKALGLNVKEQKGFFQVWAQSGHKVYIAKQSKGVSRVDTTMPRSALVINGRDISLPLAKPNGRVLCHVDPSVESVMTALEVLAGFADKIPAPKKPVAKSV